MTDEQWDALSSLPMCCPNCGCLKDEHRHAAVGACATHGCDDTREDTSKPVFTPEEAAVAFAVPPLPIAEWVAR